MLPSFPRCLPALSMMILFPVLAGFVPVAQLPVRQSPINRISADYLCTLGGDSRQQVAFLIPSRTQPARIWLTGTGKMMGLEAQVNHFGFQSCVGCFFGEGTYSFSGATNQLNFETRLASPMALTMHRQIFMDQRPPGSEQAPPGSQQPSDDEDLPPGSEPPGKVDDPPDSVEEPEPKGPRLEIHYREISLQGGRVIYQSEGFCEPL